MAERNLLGGRPKGAKIYTDEVMALIPVWVAQGMTRDQIASKIGTTIPSLNVVCSRARIRLKPGGEVRLTTQISRSAEDRLTAQAEHLNVPLDRFVALLLERVVTDDLFHAILDLPEIE